jgi:basic amino acid/polyamine antiporter, APA family
VTLTSRGEEALASHAAGNHALVRGITFWPATMLIVGNVVGSAVFLTTGTMVETLPSVSLILAAWLAGGLLACAGGLTFAELGAMLPRSGGMYVYLQEAYGSFPAFLFGWTMVLVVLPGGVAAVAVGFAESFSHFVPALSTSHIVATVPLPIAPLRISAGQVLAALSIAVLAVANLARVESASRAAALVTMLKVGAVAALAALAIAAWPQSPGLTPVVPPVARPLAAFGVVMIAVMWAYEGWSYLAFAAGEVRDPARTLPRAFIYGTIGLTLLYMLANAGYFVALPLSAMSGEVRIAEKAMTAAVGPVGASLVAAIVCLSTLGCNMAAVLACSRAGYGMASDGMFFRFAARVHPRTHTPHGALLGLAVWSCALALSGSYDQLYTYVMFASVLFNVLGGLAIFTLRRTRPDLPRPYRAWGYPIVPLVFVLGSSWLVVNTLVERPIESLAGLLLMAGGVPAYVYWRRQKIRAGIEGDTHSRR